MENCEHPEFEASVHVYTLTDEDQLRYVMEARVRCVECQTPFGFAVPDIGLLTDRPTVSPDGLELRVPLLRPADTENNEEIRV